MPPSRPSSGQQLGGSVSASCFSENEPAGFLSQGILYLQVQAPAHSSAQTVVIRGNNRQRGPVQGDASLIQQAPLSPGHPPTSPCQAASPGCFKTFSIKCVVGRAWSGMAGNVLVPTSTVDGVVASHVPAAVPAKLRWAILEHTPNAWEVP